MIICIRCWTSLVAKSTLVLTFTISSNALWAKTDAEENLAEHGTAVATLDEELERYKAAVESHNSNLRFYENDLSDYESEGGQYDQKLAVYRNAVSEHNTNITNYDSELAKYKNAVSNHNQEVDAYDHAVRHYNSLPPEQRTQFQYDRLNRWQTDINSRKAQLDRELNRLNAWHTRIENNANYLDTQKRSLDDWKKRLDVRREELVQRCDDINRRKAELDAWADQLDNRTTAGVSVETTEGNADNDRQRLPGFDDSPLGNGTGLISDGAHFPKANTANGTIVIDNVRYQWTAEMTDDITSEANKLYSTQIWTFRILNLETKREIGKAVAEIRGSATGASGDAHGLKLPNGTKIVFGVQFSGDAVRILTIRKAF